MASRDSEIRASVAMLARGGPLLVGEVSSSAGSSLYAIGVTDDQGIYVYLPLVGHLLSINDPAVLLRILYLAAMSFALLVYPLLFAKSFGSGTIGLLAPFTLVAQIRLAPRADIYWISAWAVVVGIPLVLVALRLKPRGALLVLLGAAVLGSFATSIRSQAGLPVAIAAILAALCLSLPLRYRISIGVLVAAAYLSISPGALGALRLYRDAWAGRELGAGLPTAHPFWHPTYLGLGYLPNQYGIAWNDSVAAAAVERDDPGAPYLSQRYEASLRKQYLALLQRDPSFVVRTYFAKLLVVAKDALQAWWTLLILVPVALVFASQRRTLLLQLALVAPAILVNAIPPILTLPVREYEVGWIAAWGMTWQISLGWAAIAVIAFVFGRPAPTSLSSARADGGRRARRSRKRGRARGTPP